jgi:molecular chaperone DnaJ
MDPYHVLGATPASSQREIRASFRKLAKQYHPDRNPSGEERFKEVVRAYETLGKPDRRSRYDSSAVSTAASRDRPRRRVEMSVMVTVPQAAAGHEVEVETPAWEDCPSCGGTGASGDDVDTCRACGGAGTLVLDSLGLGIPCPDCAGDGFVPDEQCLDCLGEGRRRAYVPVTAVIPPDTRPGTEISAPVPDDGLVRDDIIIKVEVGDGGGFSMRDGSVRTEVEVPLSVALEGGEIDVDGPSGKKGTISLPKPCPSGYETIVPWIGLGGGSVAVRVVVRMPDLDDDVLREVSGLLPD